MWDHAKKVQWQVLQKKFSTMICTTALMIAVSVHHPSIVPHRRSEGTIAFMNSPSN